MIITLLLTILYAGIAVILAGILALALCCWAFAATDLRREIDEP